ncbi:MAG: hypothetical protein ACK5LJ_08060 [Paracoccus sp. (in: a-proteobacteria)]
MGCTSCGGFNLGTGGGCSTCGTPIISGRVDACPNWEIPVDLLPTPDSASRKYMYILPDNTCWVLNSAGDGYLELLTPDSPTLENYRTITRVDDVSDIDGNPNTFYLLPDDTLWYVSHDGDDVVQVSVGDGGGGSSSWNSLTDKPFVSLNEDDFTVDEDGVLTVNFPDTPETEFKVPYNGGVLDNTNFVGLTGEELTLEEVQDLGWVVYSNVYTPWLLPPEDDDPEYPIVSVYTSSTTDVTIRSSYKLVPPNSMCVFTLKMRLDDLSTLTDIAALRFYPTDYNAQNSSYADAIGRATFNSLGEAAADYNDIAAPVYGDGTFVNPDEWVDVTLAVKSPDVPSLVTAMIYNNNQPITVQGKRPSLYITPEVTLVEPDLKEAR